MRPLTRAEHLQWCRERAMEYINQGEAKKAISSLISDLQKHSETRGDNERTLLMKIMLMGNEPISDQQIKDWVEGFR